MLAVVVNVLIHLWIVSSELLAEDGASLMDRARIYTDEVAAPMNLWSTAVHFPGWIAAAFTLCLIHDRNSLAALLLPQLAFLIVSSAQTALVVGGLFWLWQWGRRMVLLRVS
ncbi:hypothetical protein [Vitiosangium sp. GDMCC 1.1324]|uniref:hypothetical protein n=1 Tax=Vitiosangium sp. (strain GDMCC 1.1324) TaxID=2138576 RepID=UPI00130E965A|nr:hypothetical protein [Vitiosangium sp. GDMCC 1.1324]